MKIPSDSPFFLFTKGGELLLLRGRLAQYSRLDQVPRPTKKNRLVSASMVPYRQIKERGYIAHDGGEKILTLVGKKLEKVRPQDVFPKTASNIRVDEKSIRSDLSDATFEAKVRGIINNEIKNGEGSNFLLSRKTRGRIEAFDRDAALTILQRLIANEFGAFWNFCFFDGKKYFIGSSPERHLSFYGNTVLMNPICGTLPKGEKFSKQQLVSFLKDPKEINELFQVVDEELKMMAKLCKEGGAIDGPLLKEMRSLIHTEYVLKGKSTMDKVAAFRESMFAATMLGSPLENAARIIHKYETDSRRYYSSAVLLLGTDADGEYLDSAITIRTAEISKAGEFIIQTGASIVRDSDPKSECLEIKAKGRGLLNAITRNTADKPVLKRVVDRQVNATLESRNRYLSHFWLDRQVAPHFSPRAKPHKIFIVDNEDEFTFMLGHMLSFLNCETKFVRNLSDKIFSYDADATVVCGPGPGDPTNLKDSRMRRLHKLTEKLLSDKHNFLSVCLGHQVLCNVLGFPIVKVDPPMQGLQKPINLFGRKEIVGFYNTFFAKNTGRKIPGLTVSQDGRLINAVRGEFFTGFQFHLESVLTPNGIGILRNALPE
jgi:phenazine biosynthesis protein phzE